jgi:hypothetical protein
MNGKWIASTDCSASNQLHILLYAFPIPTGSGGETEGG